MNQNTNQSRMSNANGTHHSNNPMYNQPNMQINQPINQPNMQIHQPVNQTTKQPINQQVNQKQSILLFSNFSNECKKLRSSLLPEQINLFRPICVDNQKIRNLIESSENIQVTVVPCILEIMNNGTVAKYEGLDVCMKWINNMSHNIHHSNNSHNRLQEQVNKVHTQGLPQTPIENVIQSKQPSYQQNSQQLSQTYQAYQRPNYQEKYTDQDYPREYKDNRNSRESYQGSYREPYNENTQKLTGTQGKRPTDIKIPEKHADVNRKGPSRTAYRGEINEPGTAPSGLYSNRDMELPDRGIGHSGMRSSLHDMESDQPVRPSDIIGNVGERYVQNEQLNQVPVSRSKQVPYPVTSHGPSHRQGPKPLKMIEDLTPSDDDNINLDEDPSGMGKGNLGGDPRTVNTQSKAMQEKSNSIKRLADQISQSREESENEMSDAKQRSIRQTRKIDMESPVNI